MLHNPDGGFFEQFTSHNLPQCRHSEPDQELSRISIKLTSEVAAQSAENVHNNGHNGKRNNGHIPSVPLVLDRAIPIGGPELKLPALVLDRLAAYFAGKLAESELGNLGGQIMYADNPAACALYTAHHGDLTLDLRIRSAEMFPGNERLQSLYLRRGQEESFSADEIAELYLGRRSTDSSRQDANKIAQELKTLRANAALGQQECESAVSHLLRSEINSKSKAYLSISEIAALFAVNKSFVHAILQGQKGVLSEGEGREHARILQEKREQEELMCLVRASKALHTFVALERELHQSGVIKTLSSKQNFRKIFYLQSSELDWCLKTLPWEDIAYRDRAAKHPELHDQRDELLKAVQREMQISRQSWGDVSIIRSDAVLAEKYHLQPITVLRILADKLSHAERETRDAAVRERREQGAYRDSVVNFVAEELAAFKKGEISELSSIAKLAELFKISPRMVKDLLLQDPGKALSVSDKRLRAFVLLARPDVEPSLAALQEVIINRLHEAIEHRFLRGEIAATHAGCRHEQEKEGGKNGIDTISSRKRRSICYKGQKFDSYEEAACAVLMEKYIPGFTLQEGKNFQVRAGKYSLDFVVGGAVVEYHPIMLFRTRFGLGGFESIEEWRHFAETKQGLSKEMKKNYIAHTRHELEKRYYQQRLSAMQQNPEFCDKELIVATDAESFYYNVIHRFAGGNDPTKEQFIREFNLMKRQVRLHNQGRDCPKVPAKRGQAAEGEYDEGLGKSGS